MVSRARLAPILVLTRTSPETKERLRPGPRNDASSLSAKNMAWKTSPHKNLQPASLAHLLMTYSLYAYRLCLARNGWQRRGRPQLKEGRREAPVTVGRGRGRCRLLLRLLALDGLQFFVHVVQHLNRTQTKQKSRVDAEARVPAPAPVRTSHSTCLTYRPWATLSLAPSECRRRLLAFPSQVPAVSSRLAGMQG